MTEGEKKKHVAKQKEEEEKVFLSLEDFDRAFFPRTANRLTEPTAGPPKIDPRLVREALSVLGPRRHSIARH